MISRYNSIVVLVKVHQTLQRNGKPGPAAAATLRPRDETILPGLVVRGCMTRQVTPEDEGSASNVFCDDR